MSNWVVVYWLKTLNYGLMMLRKSYKCLCAKNMIIELGLVFQNLKLANEMNVLAIGTIGYGGLNELSQVF
jgi:hypothetical protein